MRLWGLTLIAIRDRRVGFEVELQLQKEGPTEGTMDGIARTKQTVYLAFYVRFGCDLRRRVWFGLDARSVGRI